MLVPSPATAAQSGAKLPNRHLASHHICFIRHSEKSDISIPKPACYTAVDGTVDVDSGSPASLHLVPALAIRRGIQQISCPLRSIPLADLRPAPEPGQHPQTSRVRAGAACTSAACTQQMQVGRGQALASSTLTRRMINFCWAMASTTRWVLNSEVLQTTQQMQWIAHDYSTQH